MRHEAACASGSMAILAAMAEIEAGRYDVALVIGAEIEKTVGGELGAQYLGAAAWIGNEGQEATFMWPYMFDRLADEYDRRYGLDDAHMHAIAELNVRNARRNPNAQTRNWKFTPGELHQRRHGQPVSRGPDPAHRLQRDDRRRRRDRGGQRPVPGRRTRMSLPGRGRGSSAGDTARSGCPCSRSWTTRPTTRTSCRTCARRSSTPSTGPASPTSTHLDAIETHDCFSMSEYMAIDHFGITGPGDSWKAVEGGDLEIGGRIPVNPSGGLIGGGHPVGATGVRMMLDAYKQVNGLAGDYQVDDARTVATLNIGGSTTTSASFVVGADDLDRPIRP